MYVFEDSSYKILHKILDMCYDTSLLNLWVEGWDRLTADLERHII